MREIILIILEVNLQKEKKWMLPRLLVFTEDEIR